MQKSIFSNRYQLFISELVNIRKRKEMTQTMLAMELEKPQSFISKYERLERRLDIEEYITILETLVADADMELLRILRKIRNT